MTKVYIAGPMYGYPDKNRASFQFAQDILESLYDLPSGSISNPIRIPAFEHTGPCPNNQRKVTEFDKHGAGCYYRTDLFELLQCDVAVFLQGWENSVGARLEMQVAAACGIQILFMNMKNGELFDTIGEPFVEWWSSQKLASGELIQSGEGQGTTETPG